MLIDPNGYVVYSKQFMSSPRYVVLVGSKDIQCFHAGALKFYQATILTWKEILVYDDVSSTWFILNSLHEYGLISERVVVLPRHSLTNSPTHPLTHLPTHPLTHSSPTD